MAKIPKLEFQPIQPTQHRAGSAAVGSAVAKFGGQLGQLAIQMQQIDDNRKANELSTDATRQVLDFENELDQAPAAFETHEISLKEFFTNLRADMEGRETSSAVQSAITAKVNNLELQSTMRVRSKVRKLTIDAGRSNLLEMRDILSNNYAVLNDPQDREATVQGYFAAIDQAALTGIIDTEAASKEKQQFLNDVEVLRAEADISADPKTAMMSIIDDKYAVDAKAKLKLQQKADTEFKQQIFERERMDRMQTAQIKRMQVETTNQLAADILAGRKRSVDVGNALERGQIDFSQFKALDKFARAGGVLDDDTDGVIRLTQDIYDGVAGPVEILHAHAAGVITRDTATDMLGKADLVRRRGGVLAMDNVKRARKYLDTAIGGLRGPLAILSPDQSVRVNSALREFDDRVLHGEDPTKLIEDILPRYREAPLTRSGLATPRFAVGGRDKLNIEATRFNLVNEYRAGNIGYDTFNQEAELLEQWERAE